MGVGMTTKAKTTFVVGEGTTWEQRDVVHTFEDGWTIEKLETKADRKTESDGVFQGRACITGAEWDRRLKEGYILMSLRDPEGNPKATLLFGEANMTIAARAGHDYKPYTTCKAFDQAPRCLDGTPIIAYQCCPTGYMAGDTAERMEETKRVKAWYEALPLADNFEGFRCDDPNARIAAQDFLKERDGKNTA